MKKLKVIIRPAIFLAITMLCAVLAHAQSGTLNSKLKLSTSNINISMEKLDTIPVNILCADTTVAYVFWKKGFAVPKPKVTVYKNADNYELNKALDYGSDYFIFLDKNRKVINDVIIFKAKVK